MNFTTALRLACASASLGVALGAQADSFASSASSAGSASSGSVSGSLKGSSNSSTGGDKTAAAAVDYRIVDIAIVEAHGDRPDVTRLTLQAADPQRELVLELPRAIAEQQKLGRGDRIQARQRVYGYEFARGDTRDAFYLVLADDWYGDLAARPLSL